MSALPRVRELRALDVAEVVPAGCLAMLVAGMEWSPHLCPGEFAIVDTTDTVAQPGELFALAMTVVEGERLRIVQPMRGDGGGMMFRLGKGYVDGPLTAEGWTAKCRGRVVGVMVAR